MLLWLYHSILPLMFCGKEGKMKKMFIGLIFLALIISLDFGNSSIAADKALKIAMVQWRGETEACVGFRDELKRLNYSVQYTVMNAEQKRTRLSTLLRKKLLPNLGNFDYVYSYGTTASKMTKTILSNKIPQVFSNVASPVESDIVKSTVASGENISGTCNTIPVSVQIETAMKVIKFRKLGILFNPREKNALIMRNDLYRVAAKLGIEVIDLRSPPSHDMLEQNLQKLVEKSIVLDAIYLPLDSFLITQADFIGIKLRDAQMKSIAAQKQFIIKGALLGTIPDYYNLGTKVASIVDRHQKEEKLENIPIQFPEEPLIMVNKTTSAQLGVRIPKRLLTKAIIVE